MTVVPTPTFRTHGDLSQPAISALARLLIDHARRQLESEEQRGEDQGSDDHHHQECTIGR